jgi:hypothetical protein
MNISDLNGTRIAQLDVDGPLLASENNALDIIGEAFGTDCDLIAIPVSRLAPGFLDLKTRLLGGVIQKFTNYGIRVAFIGDISAEIAVSKALHDFVYESNRTGHVLFAADLPTLEDLLKRSG